MKKTIVIIIVGFIAVIIMILSVLPKDAVIGFEFGVINCFFPVSETKDLVTVESPDRRYVATGYHVVGGAVVDDSTIIVVHTRGQSYMDRANEPVLIADNLREFSLTWPKDRLLVVKCSLDNTYSKKSFWKDVTVEYIEK